MGGGRRSSQKVLPEWPRPHPHMQAPSCPGAQSPLRQGHHSHDTHPFTSPNPSPGTVLCLDHQRGLARSLGQGPAPGCCSPPDTARGNSTVLTA